MDHQQKYPHFMFFFPRLSPQDSDLLEKMTAMENRALMWQDRCATVAAVCATLSLWYPAW